MTTPRRLPRRPQQQQQQQQHQQQRRPPKPQSWSMYPDLHDDLSSLLEDAGHPFTFHSVDDERDCIRSYDTAIMGRFHCKKCQSKVWTSKKIAITIRMYPGERYNARVYYQRCAACKTPSKPVLDDSYTERVVYRLLSWRGVEQERPVYNGESKGPHQRELCEGCKAGHCKEGAEDRVDGLLGRFSNFSI